MAKKFRSLGQRNYKKWDDWREGDYFVGILRSTYEDKFGNLNFEFDVTESNVRDIRPGSVFGCGNGAMRFKLNGVALNTECRIEYKGVQICKKGKFKDSEYHDVEVSVAVDDDFDSPDYDLDVL